METIPISVRTALMPLCYKDFHCLAAACRNNCCHGWEISFGKKDYLKIKHSAKSPELKAILAEGMSRLRNSNINGVYAHFNVGGEGTCAFQTAEGLCRLQLECGEQALPLVCRMYPRKTFYTTVAKELALSPSCEGVLALLWDLPQGIDFLEEDLPPQEYGTVKASPWLERFADVRSFCVDVLQERSLPLFRRMQLLGLLLRRLKERDWREEGVVDGWIAWGKRHLQNPEVAASLKKLPQDRNDFLKVNALILRKLFLENAAERDLWKSLFDGISVYPDWEKDFSSFSFDLRHYQELEDRLRGLVGASNVFFENLMVLSAFYMVFPMLTGPEDLWKSYVKLCVLYGFFWFAAVLACHQETSRERLFQVTGAASRGLLHNQSRMDELAESVLSKGGTMNQLVVLVAG